MINPQIQVQAEIHIHAARTAVWKKLIELADWPKWQPGVHAAQWVTGDSWQEGSQFQIADGQQRRIAVIRMVTSTTMTVWEVIDPAIHHVYTLHCTDQLGGCKVTLRCTYHGPIALWHWLRRGQRQQELQAFLRALKITFIPANDRS